ncbi:MAG: hypothetical protein HWN67_07725 [Candidatus Helarchaeota archaeon]|nr:hypothetical protein [Candidatus Helarchaeota archaeon]
MHPLEEKIEYISKKLEDLELLFIQEEELEESELKELKILSSETSKNGIPWKKLKAELNL